jgi:hypothetical protein
MQDTYTPWNVLELDTTQRICFRGKCLVGCHCNFVDYMYANVYDCRISEPTRLKCSSTNSTSSTPTSPGNRARSRRARATGAGPSCPTSVFSYRRATATTTRCTMGRRKISCLPTTCPARPPSSRLPSRTTTSLGTGTTGITMVRSNFQVHSNFHLVFFFDTLKGLFHFYFSIVTVIVCFISFPFVSVSFIQGLFQSVYYSSLA